MNGPEVRLGRWLDPVAWLTTQLRERITSGGYRPQDLLPSERDIAQETGIGRFHVRRALALLEKEGWIERRQGHGTRVIGPGGGKELTVAVAHVAVTSGTGETAFLLDGVAERLRAAGISFEPIHVCARPDLLARRPLRVARPEEVAQFPDRYAGALFIELSSPEAVEPALDLERRRFPVAAANMEKAIPVSGTRVDHEAVFRKATETLLAFGHRRIAYVGNPPNMLFYGKALEGYRKALGAAGIEPDESLAVFTRTPDALGAYLATQGLLDAADRTTAIVAGRDYLARGICQAIEEHGLIVGHEVSVISYDDLSWHVENPFLTTFHEPCNAMGAGAVELLLERITGGWRPPEQRTYDAPLILRRTVGPPARAAAEHAPVRSTA